MGNTGVQTPISPYIHWQREILQFDILFFLNCVLYDSTLHPFYCLQWVDRWRPFFEAYTNPCHVNYCFWPGFLLFTQLILSTFGSVLRTKPTINLHIATAACVVILIFAFVSPTGVYKRWPLNVLEFSFLINLGILSTLVATFCHSSGPHASSFVIPSVAIAMFLFTCIVLYYYMCEEVHVLQSISKVHAVSCCKKLRQTFMAWKGFRFGKK